MNSAPWHTEGMQKRCACVVQHLGFSSFCSCFFGLKIHADAPKTAKTLRHYAFSELFHAFPMQKSSWSPQRFRHTSLDLSIERHLQSLPCTWSILAQFLTGGWVSSFARKLRFCTSLLSSLRIENIKLKRWSFKLLQQKHASVAQQNIKASPL